jgi:antitoxin component of RelBE/YafQ-DinJ toxin-antitoxin module
MSVLFRCRVDKRALAKAERVTKELGTHTPELVRMFITQIGRTGRVPLALSIHREDTLLDVKRRNKLLLSLDRQRAGNGSRRLARIDRTTGAL